MPFVIENAQIFENLLHFARWGNQVGDPEMMRARSLLEAAARHSHNPGLVDHVHAVDKVGLFALFLRLCNKLFAEMDPRESIHRPFDVRTADVLHAVERLSE